MTAGLRARMLFPMRPRAGRLPLLASIVVLAGARAAPSRERHATTPETADALASLAEREPDTLEGWRAQGQAIRLYYAMAQNAAVRLARPFCESAQLHLREASPAERAEALATCETFGHYESAIAIAQRFVEENPSDAGPYATAGRLYYAMGRLQDAAPWFFKALERPNDGSPYRYLCRIYRENRQRKDAARTFAAGVEYGRRAIAQHPRSGPYHARLAQLLAEAGEELEEALRLARLGHQLDEGQACWVGFVLSKLGRDREAVDYFGATVAPNPCQIENSRVLERLGEHPEAERLLRALLSWNPRNREARAALGELLERISPYRAQLEAASQALASGELREAARRCKKALKLAVTDSEKADASNAAGFVHLRDDDRRTARDMFERAYRLDPSTHRLNALLSLGQDPRTVELLDEVLRQAPDNPARQHLTAWGFLGMKVNEDKSLELLQRVIASTSTGELGAQSLLLLADHHLQKQESPQALEAAAKLIKRYKGTSYYPVGLAAAAEAQGLAGRPEKAVELFRLACRHAEQLDLTAAADNWLFRLASGCQSTGHGGTAARLWRELAGRFPDDPRLQEQLGFQYRLNGQLEAARAIARRVAASTSTVGSQLQLAFVHAELGDGDACRQAVLRGREIGEEARRRGPRDAETLQSLACLVARFGEDPPRALELALRAQEAEPGARFCLGLAHLAAGQPREAAETFERVVRERPLDNMARLQWGLAYQAAGKPRRAQAIWEAGLKIEPTDRYLKLALRGKPMPWARGCGPGVGLVEPRRRRPPPVSGRVPRVAVLPMANETADLQGPGTIRALFHERLARRGYWVLPLEDTDRLLREKLGITEGGQLRGVTPKQLGEALLVDSVVYGTLHQFGMTNVGFVTKQQVKMTQRLVDAGSGGVRWERTTNAVTGDIATSAKEAKANLAGGLAKRLVELATGKPVAAESLDAVQQAIRSLPRGVY